MKRVCRYFEKPWLIALVVVIVRCASSDTLQPIDDGMTTIGIYADRGAANACVIAAENMFEWMGYTVERINAEAVNNGDIRHIDVFYFPGGSARPYIEDISEQGKDNIRQLVDNGCAYIGTCAGGLFAAEIQIWEGTVYTEDHLGIFPGTGRGPVTEIFPYPEIGMCQVNLIKPHSITNTQPDSVWILFYSGPCFEPHDGADVDIIGQYEITNQIALVACQYGDGRVFLTGPHPEWEEDSDRDSISYFDGFDDMGSDWDLMREATRWCLYETGTDAFP